MLALQKRMMEISVQPQTTYRIGDVIVHKKYGESRFLFSAFLVFILFSGFASHY